MLDHKELLRRLAAQAGGQSTISQIQAALNSAEGKQAAQSISGKHAALLEQAAQAAERGDYQQASQLAQQLMQTPEGAQIAAKLRGLLTK